MKIVKVRELSSSELLSETRRIAEQLFRIRFQLELGQKEGVKQLQTLKKDVARFKTVSRERALGIRGASEAGGSGTLSKSERKAKTNALGAS